MELINLTPHSIVFPDGRRLSRCIDPPRLAERAQQVDEVDGIPIMEKSFDAVECDLPPERDDALLIVPLAIAQAFSGRRNDLVVPNDPIRDEEGRIVGCRSLARV